MFRKIYNLIRNNIAKTKIFWRFRHIIQPDVWTSYKNDSENIRREFYSEFLNKHSCILNQSNIGSFNTWFLSNDILKGVEKYSIIWLINSII